MKAEHVSALAVGRETCKYLRAVQRRKGRACDAARPASEEKADSIRSYKTVEFQISSSCEIINSV